MTEVFEFMTAKGQGRIIREQEYGRYGNPTQQEAERKLAAIEGAERAILFSTGMSAVILTLMAYMKKDGHILFTSDCYRQTRDFATNFSANSEFKHVCSRPPPPSKTPSGPTPTSSSPSRPPIPTCACSTSRPSSRSPKPRVLTMIDATLATPYNIRPLELGIDIVIHSATKYSAATTTCSRASRWATQPARPLNKLSA